MCDLFPNILKTFDYIKNKCGDGSSNCFYIYGNKEIGKTYLIDELVSYFNYSSVIINGSNQDNYDYANLIAALNNVSNSIKKIKKIFDGAAKEATTTGVPFVSAAVSFITNYKEIKRRNKFYNINDIENEIINRIDYLAKNKPLLIVLDNFESIDASSLKLINFLYANRNDCFFKFMQNSIIIVASSIDDSINDNIEYIGAIKPQMEKCVIEKSSYNEFELYLKKKYNSLFDSKLSIRELYNIVGGNLGSAIKILNLVIDTSEKLFYDTSNSIDDLVFNILSERLKIIETRFCEIKDVLKYASIIGDEFEKALIYCLFNYDFGLIDKKLALSIEERFIDKFEEVYKFSSHYIRNFFLNLTAENKKEIHYVIALLLKDNRPSEYNLRYFHLLESQQKYEANTVLVIMSIRQILKFGQLGNSLSKKLKTLPEKYNAYLKSIHHAINLYRNNGTLSEIEKYLSLHDFDIESELLVEKEYVFALIIYHLGREKEFCELRIMLEEYFYNDIVNHDQKIRFGILLMLLYINRLGDDLSAKKIHKKLILEISSRSNIDRSLEIYLNKIKRISPALYNLETALVQTKESMNYFKNNIEYDINEYVYSLTNHIGTLIVMSKYDEAYAVSLEGFALINNYNTNKSYHKFFNNYIISGLYSNNIPINDCELVYETLLETDENLNSKSLLKNNYAVVLAKNNKINESYHILLGLMKEFSEGQKNDYYKYLFSINYVSICIINNNFQEALTTLNNLNFLIPKICIKEESEILESYNVLYDIINLKSHMEDYNQFDSLYSIRINNNHGKYWREPLKLTDLQYWSEF